MIIRGQKTTQKFILPRSVWVDKHGKEVPAGSKEARMLLGAKGSGMPMAAARRAGLLGPEPVDVAIDPPTSVEPAAESDAPEGPTLDEWPDEDGGGLETMARRGPKAKKQPKTKFFRDGE